MEKTAVTKPKVLGMGNALVDIIYNIDSDDQLEELHLPKGSMTLVDETHAQQILGYFSHKKATLATGGSASNTITAISQLGVSCGFLGRTGSKDLYGEFYREDLLKRGITPHLSQSEINTGTAITLMSPDTERTFATYLGAASTLRAEDITEDIFRGYDYFHIEGYMVQNYELLEAALDMAKKTGLKISYDMASYNVISENREFVTRMLKKGIDIVFANQEESMAYTGKEELQALCLLSELTPTAIVKLGGRGSMIMHEGKLSLVGAEKVKKIDSNGAGDSYAGGFLYGMCQGLPIEICGEIASTVATEVVKIIGPKLSDTEWDNLIPRIREIEKKAWQN